MNETKTQKINQAIGAGRWFPGDTATLRSMVEEYIQSAEHPAVQGRIAAAIAPHAGYIYSGAVAGHVFRALRDQAATGKAPATAVLLGFSHNQAFAGIAVMEGDAIRTPLGITALDKEAAAMLINHSARIFPDNRPHHGEHSAENLIPFVQAALPDTKLLPMIIGDHDSHTRGALLTGLFKLAEKTDIVVIASSDMLHDPDYDKVTRTDRTTLAKTEALETEAILDEWQSEHQIYCGIAPVAVAIEFARRRGCRQGITLHYRNSGDDHPESRGQWVVGYGAVVFPVAKDEFLETAVPAVPGGI